MTYEGRKFKDEEGVEWEIVGPWPLGGNYYQCKSDTGEMAIRPVGVVNAHFRWKDQRDAQMRCE